MTPPIPFPQANHIPIVGQPCAIHGWLPTILVTCNCDAKTPLLLVGLQAVVQCQACKRAFAVGAIHHDPATGNGSVNVVAVVVPTPPDLAKPS